MAICLSRLPCNTFLLAKILIKHWIAVVPCPVFNPDPENKPSALRLNFTNYNLSDFIENVTRLSKV